MICETKGCGDKADFETFAIDEQGRVARHVYCLGCWDEASENANLRRRGKRIVTLSQTVSTALVLEQAFNGNDE